MPDTNKKMVSDFISQHIESIPDNANHHVRFKFSLTSYICSVRNSYFHGEKEYPLFVIKAEDQVLPE